MSEIFLAANLRPDTRLDEVKRLAASLDVPIRTVDRRELDKMSVRGAHQGVVARLEAFRYADLDEVLEGVGASETAIVVVADEITDPQNLGSMIRTCEVAGVAALVVGKHRSAHVTPATVKAAAGATEHLPIVEVTNSVQALDKLKEAGFWIAGTADDAELELWDVDLAGKIGLVFGSEGRGLGRLVRERCDWLVRIPAFGRIDSLNVSAATAVVVYEAIRQQRAKAAAEHR